MALDKEKQQSADRYNELEFDRILKFLEEEKQVPAIVTQVGGEWKINDTDIYELANSEYLIDLYERGITRDSLGTVTSKPTRQNVLAKCLISTDKRAVDSELLVTMLNGRAYIRPQQLPADTGFGKVLMLVDDLTPGSWRADYVRFVSPAPES